MSKSMERFKMVLKTNRGNEVGERILGDCEDFARETFGNVRRRMEEAHFPCNLTLVNPEGDVIIEFNHDPEGE